MKKYSHLVASLKQGIPEKYRPLFLGTGVYGFSLAISKSFSVIITPLLTRIFSSAQYGAMDSILAMTALLPSFMSLNLEWALTRYYYEFSNLKERKKFQSTIIFTVALLDLLIIAMCTIFAEQISIILFGLPLYQNEIRFAVLGIGLQLMGALLLWILRLQQRLKQFMTCTFVGVFANLIFIVMFSYILKQGIISYFWALGLSNFIQLILLLSILLGEFSPSISRSLLLRSLKFSIPVAPSVVIIAFIGFFARYLLIHYSDLTQTGLFAVANKIATFALMIFLPFQMAWQTYSMSVMHREDVDKIYSNITRYVVFVLCVCMQAVILFAPEIIRVVAGSAYSQAVDILRLVIIGLFASYLFYFFHLSITIAEKLVLLLATYLIALVISLISGFILIPLFGGMGAGMAYAITFIIQSLSLYFLAQRQQHYNYPVKRIYGSIFASFLLIIPLSLVYVNLAIRSIIFVFLLFISIYVFIDELRKPSMFLQRFELNMDKID